MPVAECNLTEQEVSDAFLAAPPAISQAIIDLSIINPVWLRDLYKIQEWPRGSGTQMQQLIVRGGRPKIERGFAAWKKLNNNTGCDPCDGPDCSYNWTTFPGLGIERKVTSLMSREFKSPPYCIKEIQTTSNFKEVFAKVVENLYAQVDYFKELNIGQNILTELAKKYVVDSGGPKPNTQNPYVYRPAGTARLSTLNIEMLEFFYEYMRKIPDCVPYDVVNGSPIFSIIASHQLLGRLYRDDQDLRQDVRFSGLANDLLSKYNFMSTIRGMFIAAPVLYPRRFILDAVTGVATEVLPFVDEIPMEVGSFTGFNPLYEAATHEELILHGKFPFSIFVMPTEQSLGQNTSFGPEFSLFNNWAWINPLTMEDPFRRLGYFATSATIGISQQYSDGIFAILVERVQPNLAATWLCEPLCPPETVDCDNEVPDVTCPCPLILGFTANPITGNSYIITLAVPTTAVVTDEIQFGIDTGGYVTGTVTGVSADSLSVEVTFPQGTDLGNCDRFTTIFCDDTLGCSANIIDYRPNCTDNTRVDLVLSNPIKGDVGETITITNGDGTTSDVTIISIDYTTNTWVVDYGATVFCDTVGGLVSVCVPTATDASCPACGGPTATQCS